MATFTLPCELRPLAWFNQKTTYTILFQCVASTLKDFGINPKHLGAEIGMTMVLHTNTRNLDFHPHIHAVIPGGGIDRRSRYWKKTKRDYLFNGKALAKVFRARFLEAILKAGLIIPVKTPKKWVGTLYQCRKRDRGSQILIALSLPRGDQWEKYYFKPKWASHIQIHWQQDWWNKVPLTLWWRLFATSNATCAAKGI